MKGKYICLRYLLLLTLSFILFLNIPLHGLCSTSSGSSGGGSSRGYIYDSNSLNAKVIREFNSMSNAEREDLIKTVYPMLLTKLGVKFTGGDPYTICNDHYHVLLALAKTNGSAQEYYEANYNGMILHRDRDLFVEIIDGQYYWYDDLVEPLTKLISVDTEENKLVLNDTAPFYMIVNDIVDEETAQNGFVFGEMYSYMNINTDQFNNVGLYGDFIRLCKEHSNLGVGYVFVMKDNTTSRIVYVMFANKKPNIYNSGTTITNSSLQLCDDDGNYTFTFDIYRQANAGATQFDKINENSKLHNLGLGSSTVPSGNVFGITNGYKVDGFGIYTLNPNKARYYFSTSLNGWINSQGHYEPNYQFYPNYGNVPTVTISSNDMTTYYIQNYTDNSSGDTIYYPPNYNDDDVGYDDNNKTVKFNGVVDFLESIGALIGSLINGIAKGLANIINSLATIVNNLQNNLMQGVIFEFLRTFIGWLPVEIVSLLTALFAVTVIFALIKLLKGFF